jgi:exopolyphosphatase/pppGpp-phosphohydrolase
VLLAGGAACRPANDPRAPMCAIDMGSNSFRRIVGGFDGEYRELAMEVRRLGVGDDVSAHGRISDAKLAEIERTLTEFRESCARDGAVPIRAVGTAAFRDAPNAETVVQRASALGIQMEIATEQRESELAYRVGSLGQANFAVIDNGSRSIELVADDGGNLHHRVFNLGYRVAFDRFFAGASDPAAAIADFREELDKELAGAGFMRSKRKLVGLEFGEMADLLFPPAENEGRVFTREQLRQRLNAIAQLSAGDFERLKQTEEIDHALPRLVVAEFVTEAFGYPQLELTRRELGSGLIIEAGRR